MSLTQFIERLNSPDTAIQITFQETMDLIDRYYVFTPCAFQNGDQYNAAGQNNGSCKLFAFAKLHQLNEEQTLNCFGHYYHEDVLLHPEANDHQNIRNFIRSGWSGVKFEGIPLHLK